MRDIRSWRTSIWQRQNKAWSVFQKSITNKFARQLPDEETIRKYTAYSQIPNRVLTCFTEGKALIRNSYAQFKDSENNIPNKEEFIRRTRFFTQKQKSMSEIE